ncbi:alpha/beta fold hydrolase [Jeotgalibacillus proteolyticus]|uniref:2-succinyl-6-hydroxy-2, 4-cyclohexadiene-1-carboxylate synthase n=1 Tax=Jeotgalibacillus proteolyticus TaxID=2082395 RepID=A0A2S5GCK7_9BACL|nr:alpha/beta hydrolase [Jeotgalibacillus proteolyticus]PPA70633.1 2-succinyl-6-hydroxy-2,4-cyclohexadiene-1-carboxylate synthase [Jeotgalibacillus proteolyticus]
MLHYRAYSSDESMPWVTFIHGAGGSSSIWFKQVKEFRKHFNVLVIDLRGHGQSERGRWKKGDSFKEVSHEVIDVMHHLSIKKTHFVGVSLGTIVVQTISKHYPEYVSSLVLTGAIIKLDIRTKLLLWIGRTTKRFIPYMLLYKLFAWIIMPNRSHEESRLAFVNSAKKMCQKEFIKWFSLTRMINPYLDRLQIETNGSPTMFIMGEEDYLFRAPVEELVRRDKALGLVTIKNAGHVCNIDQPEAYNQQTIDFINKIEASIGLSKTV